MIILILAGVLLGGIGTGAALVEFSDLEYNGTVWYGTEELTETKLIYEMDDRDVDQVYCYTGGIGQNETEVIEDRKVPLDEIWFEISYNPEYGEPVLDYYGAYENGDYLREDVHIWTVRSYDEFEVFMELKDRILEELKEKKLSSYRFELVTGMKVYVHPQNVSKMNMMY